ncbi:hypothetical protein BGAL_0021g00420 [Botrytis galanthina]|uniref:Uncharacterized protein n=1 Tax=Botrytis galanthina TaxID=278940 RepID=A0A4S8RJ39_9HELO|nr:hypothetical protein BGAL_0021g00420 [Botrytis galanthina]
MESREARARELVFDAIFEALVEEVAGLCPACPRPVAETPQTGPHEREVLQYSWKLVILDQNRDFIVPMGEG